MFTAYQCEEENAISSGSIAPCPARDCSIDAKRSPVICSQLLPSVIPYAFATGDRLEAEDLPPHIMAIVAVGTARTEWILDNGRRQVLGFHFKGEALAGPYRFAGIRTVAVTQGILHLIKEKDLYRCQKWHPGSGAWENSAVQESLDRLAAQNMLLGQFTAREKIATFLHDLAERIGVPRGKEVAVALSMKRDDIADHLGLNTETVSRQLSRMRTGGLLELPRPGELIIKDHEALSDLLPFFRENKPF